MCHVKRHAANDLCFMFYVRFINSQLHMLNYMRWFFKIPNIKQPVLSRTVYYIILIHKCTTLVFFLLCYIVCDFGTHLETEFKEEIISRIGAVHVMSLLYCGNNVKYDSKYSLKVITEK